jgi:hypothetical protein
MAGYDFFAKESGAFLVRLSNCQVEANQREARIKSNQDMLSEHSLKWAETKQKLKEDKKEVKRAEKAARFEAEHGMTKEQKQE